MSQLDRRLARAVVSGAARRLPWEAAALGLAVLLLRIASGDQPVDATSFAALAALAYAAGACSAGAVFLWTTHRRLS